MKHIRFDRLLLAMTIVFSTGQVSHAQGAYNYGQIPLADQFQSAGDAGDFGRDSFSTGAQARSNSGNYDFSGLTANQSPVSRGGLQPAATALLAPDSEYIDKAPIPSGDFKYGFPEQGSRTYRGVSGGRATGGRRALSGAPLPPTATSSVDFNICDMPFLRRNLGYPNAWSPPGALEVAGPPIVLPSGNPPPNPNPGTGGSTGGGGNPGAGSGNGYVSGAPSYRYTADGGYMTGSGIVVYPDGRRVQGGPMFMYRSGYGFTDMRNPSMGWTWDRSAVYRPYT